MKTIKEEQPPVLVKAHRTEAEILGELVDLEFSKGIDSLPDVFAELTGRPYTDFPDELCRKYVSLLHRHIIFKALEWGFGDTEVRDEIYSHFKSFGLPDEKDL